jgi:glyoxylate carboligase
MVMVMVEIMTMKHTETTDIRQAMATMIRNERMMMVMGGGRFTESMDASEVMHKVAKRTNKQVACWCCIVVQVLGVGCDVVWKRHFRSGFRITPR